MYYGRKMEIDDTNLSFVSLYDTSKRHFFIGGRIRHQNLTLFVIYKFFPVKKSRLFACLFTQLKGRTGE
jgi:hypothetical protein